jgi:presenilin-like A22 family membrane protease
MGGRGGAGELEVSANFAPGQVLPVNARIDLEFSAPIDPETVSFLTISFVFLIPLWLALWPISDSILRDNLATIGAFLLAVLIISALYKYPEWYLVDTVGIAIAAGVTAVLGVSFSILPAFLLLAGLALYDAWAVYRSKHMVTLADEMTSQRLPILLVVPKKASYSYLEQPRLKEQIDKGEEREAHG